MKLSNNKFKKNLTYHQTTDYAHKRLKLDSDTSELLNVRLDSELWMTVKPFVQARCWADTWTNIIINSTMSTQAANDSTPSIYVQETCKHQAELTDFDRLFIDVKAETLEPVLDADRHLVDYWMVKLPIIALSNSGFALGHLVWTALQCKPLVTALIAVSTMGLLISKI